MKKEALQEELQILLLPRDPHDEKDVIMEIRAGAGGDEASLFAQDLFRMYSRYAEHQGWKTDVLNTNISPIGGFKEIIFNIRGTKSIRCSNWKAACIVSNAFPKLRLAAASTPLRSLLLCSQRLTKWTFE